MAKLTVVKVAKRCLEISKQLNPQLDDPRLQDLRVSIEQARRAIKEGQLPRWQVKRLVDTVALTAMLTGNAELAEQVFGLWMKSGQSISQNPASLVLEPLPDLGKKSSGERKTKMRPAPAPPREASSPAPNLKTAPDSSRPVVPKEPEPAPAPIVSSRPAVSAVHPQDSFDSPERTSPHTNPGQPAAEVAAKDVDNPQSLGMGLAAMVSAAYAAENDRAQNPADSAEVRQAPSTNPAPPPLEAESDSHQINPEAVVTTPVPAVSANTEWSASRGQIPWLPVQSPASEPDQRGEVQPAPAESSAADSSQVKPETSPVNVLAPGSEFPPRRSLVRQDLSSPRPTLASTQIRPAPAPPSDQPLPSAAPPKPAALPQPASIMPLDSPASPVPNPTTSTETPPAIPMSSPAALAQELTAQPQTESRDGNATITPLAAAQPPEVLPAAPAPASPEPASPEPAPTGTPAAAPTEVAAAQAAPLDDAAIWDYFQKMGFDSKLNMSFEEFVARKNHTVTSSAGTGSNIAAHSATQPGAPRSAFAEVPDEMPASLLSSQSESSVSALSPAESALRRAAQSPLAPSRVPPAAPHKPREILADADRQPSTRLITIRVRGYFDYQPRFTRPKQRLDEPAVAGSTTSFAKSIISAEGPMPLDFLARRLCQKYRIEYHDQRPEEISRCLGPGLRLVSEPGMRTVWPAQVDPLSWNTALQSPIGLPRKLESLTLTEVANALRWQISRTNSMERTVIIGEAFKLLYGISPLTAPARQLADRAISYGIANNLLEAGDGTLWLP
ncbi:hypothetical protein [Varibaculum cambriense]|uniref:hypothetical protein n=1 Tax=Varibaculum cambriense TaxID=184870 RepID=UPI0029157F72|nr:hypothetical protein [Varibaculum cambriense]MDU5541255.1 hypothetical protein [Varibaculum cambriense]